MGATFAPALWVTRSAEASLSIWICALEVGHGPRSLPVAAANFLKPWAIVYTRYAGLATEIAQSYVD